MPFETFTKTRQRNFDPIISIWSNGQIAINRMAVDEYALEGFTHVLLQYDREAQLVGLQFLDTALAEGAIKMTKRRSGVILSGRAFFDYYKICRDRSTRYGVVFDQEAKRLVLNLNEPL